MNASGEPGTILKDRVWLALVLGPLVWIAAFGPWIDWDSTASVCLVVGGSFCLNLSLVSVLVPRLMR
jgi:hypothetical protein